MLPNLLFRAHDVFLRSGTNACLTLTFDRCMSTGSTKAASGDAKYPSRLLAKHRRPLPEVKNDSYFALTAIRATKLLQER